MSCQHPCEDVSSKHPPIRGRRPKINAQTCLRPHHFKQGRFSDMECQTSKNVQKMIQICEFNPACDVEEVVPDLAPDISEMMITHTVPATSSTDTPYSNESKIEDVGHYLRDKIEVAMAQYRLNQKISSGASAPANANSGSTSGEQA